jgi:hypothetical protein
MKEIKDAEIRGMSNKMFSAADEQHQDSDVEDGTFMVQIPKAVSRTNLADAETDYMSEVRKRMKVLRHLFQTSRYCRDLLEILFVVF